MGQQKGGKKLRRGSRHSSMYAAQFARTERNKKRRIKRNTLIASMAQGGTRESYRRHLEANRRRRAPRRMLEQIRREQLQRSADQFAEEIQTHSIKVG